MNVVLDRINSLKSQLNNVSGAHVLSTVDVVPPSASTSIYLSELHSSLSILSAPAKTTPSLDQIARLIVELNQAKLHESESIAQDEYVQELEWLFLARCSVDVYGCLLEQLFQQTLPLARDIFYWDDVLSNPGWRLLFLVQSNHVMET